MEYSSLDLNGLRKEEGRLKNHRKSIAQKGQSVQHDPGLAGGFDLWDNTNVQLGLIPTIVS